MAIVNVDVYRDMDEKYGKDMEKLFGPGLMSWPEDVDSSRLYMFSSNLKQILTLINPEVPHVMTGYENATGKFNHSFKMMNGIWEVKAIIPKFKSNLVYMMVLYNQETDTYDMVEKQIAENLTEKFGFAYNTDTMDSLKVGDRIADRPLYKSTSYDDHMNYRCGKNANVMYITDNETIEDAIKIRKGWADQVKTVEVDQIDIPINDNDILLNIYGDDKEYKAFPNIGEEVIDCSVCAVRRVNLNHILYDFQPEMLRKITDTDTEYVTSKNAIIYDMDIFYNGDEPFPDNAFYHQLKTYYDMECAYADTVTKWCKDIKKSGSKYTPQVAYYKARYQYFTDPEYKWKDRDKVFSNIVVHFKTRAIVTLEEGFKLTGRYGDKGIISNITDCDAPNSHAKKDSPSNAAIKMAEGAKSSVMNMLEDIDITEKEKEDMVSNVCLCDDCDMPYLDDGTVVDILLNSSGAIRRWTTCLADVKPIELLE